MLDVCIEIINAAIKFVYILNMVYVVGNILETKAKNILYVTIFCMGYWMLEGSDYKSYVFQTIYTLGISWMMCIKYKIGKKERIYFLCTILCIYELINMFGIIIGALSAWIILPIDEKTKVITAAVSLSIKLFCTVIIIKNIQKRGFLKENLFIKSKIICWVYFLVVCFKIPFLYTDVMYGALWKMVLLSISCCTAVFFIISQIDKHNAAKEKARVEESNKLLSAKLHKSQEILPAMVQVLSDVTENNGAEMEERKAHKLLEEVSRLYEQQLRENGKEDLQLKSFKSTGLTMLDQQLMGYQREAIDNEINLDIFVQAPINDVIRKGGIDQLRLQRSVGDLIRNAFQAVRKGAEKSKHVLLIVGCRQEDILEIAVMDNGVEFPLYVLEAFGKRGVTTGGTGNGLADIWEFAKDAKASLRVDEFEGKEDLFTKKISIIFDEKQLCYLNSPRGEMINSFLWNKRINE